MSKNICAACSVRGKTWKGDDPRCAFDSPDKTFSKDNWNCATLNELRRLFCLLADKDSDAIVSNCFEDRTTAYMFVAKLFEESAPDRILSLWTTWYKDRGHTDRILLLSAHGALRSPTEQELIIIIDYLKKIVIIEYGTDAKDLH